MGPGWILGVAQSSDAIVCAHGYRRLSPPVSGRRRAAPLSCRGRGEEGALAVGCWLCLRFVGLPRNCERQRLEPISESAPTKAGALAPTGRGRYWWRAQTLKVGDFWGSAPALLGCHFVSLGGGRGMPWVRLGGGDLEVSSRIIILILT